MNLISDLKFEGHRAVILIICRESCHIWILLSTVTIPAVYMWILGEMCRDKHCLLENRDLLAMACSFKMKGSLSTEKQHPSHFICLLVAVTGIRNYLLRKNRLIGFYLDDLWCLDTTKMVFLKTWIHARTTFTEWKAVWTVCSEPTQNGKTPAQSYQAGDQILQRTDDLTTDTRLQTLDYSNYICRYNRMKIRKPLHVSWFIPK